MNSFPFLEFETSNYWEMRKSQRVDAKNYYVRVNNLENYRPLALYNSDDDCMRTQLYTRRRRKNKIRITLLLAFAKK